MSGMELRRFNEVSTRFKKIENNIQNLPEPFLQEAGGVVLSDVYSHFANEGPPGEQWAKYDPDTEPSKKGMLRRSGKLYRSIKVGWGKGFIRAFVPRRIHYGRYHQKGEGGLPERRFLVLSDAAFQLIKDLAAQHLFKK